MFRFKHAKNENHDKGGTNHVLTMFFVYQPDVLAYDL